MPPYVVAVFARPWPLQHRDVFNLNVLSVAVDVSGKISGKQTIAQGLQHFMTLYCPP